MIGLMLQTGVFGGYNFTDLLNSMKEAGFFAYMLPFMLIFALVFAILTKVKIFDDNKGPAVIVALAVGLLSLQLNFVSEFFQTIFPNLGIGLSIMLVALILFGAFIPVGKEIVGSWIFFGLGALVFIIVTFVSFSTSNSFGAWDWRMWWERYGGIFLFLLMLVGVIVTVAISKKK